MYHLIAQIGWLTSLKLTIIQYLSEDEKYEIKNKIKYTTKL